MNRELKLLSRLYGIGLSYLDNWGNKHYLSEEIARQILISLGANIETSFEGYRKNSWNELTFPVKVVVQTKQPLKLILSLPTSDQIQDGQYRFVSERGNQIERKFKVSELKLIRKKTIEGIEYRRLLLCPDIKAEIGYHRLEIQVGKLSSTVQLIIVPEKAFVSEIFNQGKKVWGVAAQVYSLNSKRNSGFGDYTDLLNLVDCVADHRGSLVGLSPLHANFIYNPEQVSPYSPSSRTALNTLYIDASELTFEKSQNTKEFLDFIAAEGDRLEKYALFEALAEHLKRQDSSCWGWPVWPKQYQNPNSPEVKAFALENRQRIKFFKFLQWCATEQLGKVASRTKEKKMPIGLYFDLALSADRVGVDVWADQDLYALGLKVGCPPDDYSLEGQDWGFAPIKPRELVRSGFAAFIQALRFNMRFAGAIRLDHAMSLMRLFCGPFDKKAKFGTYLRYPFREMVGILCLESVRNKCLVIGEDLGTVPAGFRERMEQKGILSYKVLLFMKHPDGSFVNSVGYQRQSLVTSTTHDMATLWGFWQAKDIELRRKLNFIPDETNYHNQLSYRHWEKKKLLEVLHQEGILGGEYLDENNLAELRDEIFLAIQRFLSRTNSEILVVPLEDICKQLNQINVPGVVAEYPSWQHSLSIPLEELNNFKLFTDLTKVMQEEGRFFEK